MDFDRQLTLAQLVGDRWRRPGQDATALYAELCQLRHLPVRELNREDLRLLVIQHVGLEFTVPLALEHVEENPLVQANLFSGDLLTSLLRVDASFWEDHAQLRDRVSAVLDSLRDLPWGTEETVIVTAERFPG